MTHHRISTQSLHPPRLNLSHTITLLDKPALQKKSYDPDTCLVYLNPWATPKNCEMPLFENILLILMASFSTFHNKETNCIFLTKKNNNNKKKTTKNKQKNNKKKRTKKQQQKQQQLDHEHNALNITKSHLIGFSFRKLHIKPLSSSHRVSLTHRRMGEFGWLYQTPST